MLDTTATPASTQHFTVARTPYDKLMTGHEPRRRRKRGPFVLKSKMLAEMTAIVRGRHGALPDTDDADIYVMAVVALAGRSPVALLCWLRSVGVVVTPAQAEMMVDQTPPVSRKADALGRLLHITWAERERFKITTMRAHDVTPARAAKLRKAKRAERERVRRAAKAGYKPRQQYLAGSKSRTEPWKAAGFRTRRTWERHGQPVSQVRMSQVRGHPPLNLLGTDLRHDVAAARVEPIAPAQQAGRKREIEQARTTFRAPSLAVSP